MKRIKHEQCGKFIQSLYYRPRVNSKQLYVSITKVSKDTLQPLIPYYCKECIAIVLDINQDLAEILQRNKE